MDIERDAWTKEYFYNVRSRDAGGHVVVEIFALEPARDGNGKVLPATDRRNDGAPKHVAFAVELPGVRRHSHVANEFRAHYSVLVDNAMGEYPDYKPLSPERLAPMLFGFTTGSGGFVRPYEDGPKD